MLSDVHTHMYRVPPDEVAGVVKRMERMNVKIVLIAGVDYETSVKTVKIAQSYEPLYACVGVHPWYSDTLTDAVYEKLLALAKEKKVVAVSETGIDYVYRRDNVYAITFIKSYLPKEVQGKAFANEVRIAKEARIPLVVHENSSHSDILEILRREGASKVGGVIHGFIGDMKTAEQYLNMGFYISVGKRAIWDVAFDPVRAPPLRKVIEETPLDKLLIETESSEPADVWEVAAKVAELKGSDMAKVGDATASNLKRLLKL